MESISIANLSAAQQTELEWELAQAATFEDLPGKWQAALLEAEAEPDQRIGSSRPSRCCTMRAVAPQTKLPSTV